MPNSEKSAKVSSDHAYLKILLSSIFQCRFHLLLCQTSTGGMGAILQPRRAGRSLILTSGRKMTSCETSGSLTQDSGLTNGTFWLVVSTPLKKSKRHLGSLFPIYGKMKNGAKHQPAFKTSLFGATCFSPMGRIDQLPQKDDVHLYSSSFLHLAVATVAVKYKLLIL